MKDWFIFQKSFYLGCAICVKESFILASKGKEEISTLIWRWSVMSYLLTYFIFYKLVNVFGPGFVAGFISLLVILFYIWHIVAIVRCSPKKKKLTKAEKKQKKLTQSGGVIAKSFAKKFLLQEPWFRTKNSSFVIVIDLLIITFFVEYII